jgi:hypothetical protein
MVYAYAHDQTVENDYFAAMGRIEQRLELVDQPVSITIPVIAPERRQLISLAEQLFAPEMAYETRLEIASQMRNLLTAQVEWIPPPLPTIVEAT